MVIDFHTHIFPDKIAASTIAALSGKASIMPHTDGTEAGLLSALSSAGVDIAVNLPVLTGARQFDSILRFGEAINQKSYTGPSIISFAGVHPDIEDAEAALSEIKARGFLGIKIHPDYQGTFIDDERYVRLLSVAKRLDLITVTHSGLDGAYVGEPIKCTPTRAMRLLDKLSGYETMVFAHLGANEMYDELYNILAGEDVYFDTAYSLRAAGREWFFKLLSKHSADKILFATDSPWRNIKDELELIRSYGLDSHTESKILSENAISLLNLNK